MVTNGISAYRSIYVLQSSIAIHLMMKYWEPLFNDEVLWILPVKFVMPLYTFGFLWTLTATLTIDHFDLFGIKQSTGCDFMAKVGLGVTGFTTRAHYMVCRHPIMLGFFMMFTFIPRMTLNHVFFSVSCAAYIFIAVTFFEEPDLVATFKEYKTYQKTTPAYCPFGCLRK